MLLRLRFQRLKESKSNSVFSIPGLVSRGRKERKKNFSLSGRRSMNSSKESNQENNDATEVVEKKKCGDFQAIKERRTFLKRSSLVAGGAALGLVALDRMNAFSDAQKLVDPQIIPTPRSSGGGPTISVDAVLAYAYLHQSGQVFLQRDQDGRLTQLEYGPMTLTIARDESGTMLSFTASIPSDSISQTHTLLRGPDGSISSIIVS